MTSDDARKPKQFSAKRRPVLSNLLHWFTLPGWRTRPFQRFALSHSPTSPAGQAELDENLQAGRAYTVVLPKPSVLAKEVALPRKARAQATQVLKLKQQALEEETGRRFVVATQGPQRSSDGDLYVQYLAKSSDVDAIETRCIANNVELASIAVAAEHGDMTVYGSSTRTQRFAYGWWLAACLAAMVFLGWLLQIEMSQHRDLENELQSLRAANIDLEDQLSNRAQNQREAQTEEEAILAAFGRMDQDRRVAQSLADLTVFLPDDIWLTEFVWTSARLRLAGSASSDPISVIEQLTAQPWIEQIDLLQPIRTDRQSQRRAFDLEVTPFWQDDE